MPRFVVFEDIHGKPIAVNADLIHYAMPSAGKDELTLIRFGENHGVQIRGTLTTTLARLEG